jgi:hypothetical protein
VRHSRTYAGLDAAARRRLGTTIARSQAIFDRSRQASERCDALMAEAAERFGPRSSRDPLLHLLGEDEVAR